MRNIFTCFIVFLFTAMSLSQDNNWQTKFEKSGFFETSRYNETMDYFNRIAEHTSFAKFFTFGTSPQGRELKCLVISKDKAFTPALAKKTGKPVIMIINGIHSGEIEGKDACMLLLREIFVTGEKKNFIDSVTLVIVPIFSVDAHERFSKFNRINQNGPEEMGWRTTAEGYNLNRDWMKADASEMRAMLKLYSAWLPDFFVDTHTTDGADYQYYFTYGMETHQSIYDETAVFIKNKFLPYFISSLEKNNYPVTSYVMFKEWRKAFESGLTDGAAPPRFSTGYAAIQNRPGLLTETHMMKPYKDRVFSTKTALEAVITFCSENASRLVSLNNIADINSIKKYVTDRNYYPLNFDITGKSVNVKFKGKVYRKEHSDISGVDKIVYYDRDTTFDVKMYNDVVITDSVKAPAFYLIPQEWKQIIERLKIHNVEMEMLDEEKEYTVTKYRFDSVKFSPAPNEGRQRVSFTVIPFTEKVKVPRGTVKVNTSQRTFAVILHLLEPEGEDSFAKWGFFNTIFDLKEYFEDYVMEKYAAEMLKNDSKLKSEFEKKLSDDPDFINNPEARLMFFYERTPYFDNHYRIYPVMRVE